jgi:hypothetical protein
VPARVVFTSTNHVALLSLTDKIKELEIIELEKAVSFFIFNRVEIVIVVPFFGLDLTITCPLRRLIA